MTIAKLYGIRKTYIEEATWCQLSIDSQPNAISFLTPNNVGKKTKEEMLTHIQWLRTQIEHINKQIQHKVFIHKNKQKETV